MIAFVSIQCTLLIGTGLYFAMQYGESGDKAGVVGNKAAKAFLLFGFGGAALFGLLFGS